jgi:hypothetical protein
MCDRQLIIQNLIANKNALIAAANNDLARCGTWQRDYTQLIDEIDVKIEELFHQR